MSLEASIWAWDQNAGTSSNLLVLLRLANHAGPDGRCWPSQGHIAAKCRLSIKGVSNAMRDLESRGLITRERRMNGMKRLPDLVRLCLTEVIVRPQICEDEERPDFAGTERPDFSGSLGGSDRNMHHVPVREQELSAEKSVTDSNHPDSEAGALALDVLAAKLFAACPPDAQRRGGDDSRKIEWALRDAQAEGHDPAVIVESLIAYYEDPKQREQNGKYAKTPHRAIDDGKWRTWMPIRSGNLAPGPTPSSITFNGVDYAVPSGASADAIGTATKPGIMRQHGWMKDWSENPARWKTSSQGPRPGEPGCRVWPSVLAKFGVDTGG
jgi:hypothetical protein